MQDSLRDKLDLLPASPGVYLFKDRSGAVLYVGKAASLRNRVRSYFQQSSSDQRYFIGRLQAEIDDLETYVAENEKEAALLESSLIKEHRPRYNVKLRDDKDFLSLRLDLSQPWPRLEVVRRPHKDGARYFGPYHAASSARSTLRLANRFFQLRTCRDSELRSRTRPCLQYQIKRCLAPCVLDVDPEQYARQIKNVTLFLDGRHDQLIEHLQQQMQQASYNQDYEAAAVFRDQIRAIESTRQKQRVSLVSDLDQDVFGYFRQDDKAELAVLLVRSGRVVALRTFALRDVRLPDDDLVSSFVGEYYERGSFLPDEIILPRRIEAMQGLSELFSERRGAKTRLIHPQRGAKSRLLRMAMDNATHSFQQKARNREDMRDRLTEMQQRLKLSKYPERIECVDISHSSGADTVAAVVSLYDGEPDRKRYRSFHLRSIKKPDDYAAMSEVLSRRFIKAEQGVSGWERPDLLVVDGGKGQLSIAQSVLQELDIRDLDVVALAKEKMTPLGQKSVDRIYLPGRMNPIELREVGPAWNALALARDEAHRVSNQLREKKGKRQKLRSELDEVRGVGPKTRAKLLKNLGSIHKVKSATLEELIQAGATRRQAKAIQASLQEPGRQEQTDEANLRERSE